ncbi:hypothetical protein [Kribbella speibonae]|uniref:hypothetical protein n=1 Tax=Kribbella speibonae TaxID=1572660 RepID=UPI0013F3FBF2|nr:hypothetical protein [Kribbella speibonae]
MPEDPGSLQQLLNSGEVTPPTEHGLPDVEPDLAPAVASLSALLIEDRDNERRN